MSQAIDKIRWWSAPLGLLVLWLTLAGSRALLAQGSPFAESDCAFCLPLTVLKTDLLWLAAAATAGTLLAARRGRWRWLASLLLIAMLVLVAADVFLYAAQGQRLVGAAGWRALQASGLTSLTDARLLMLLTVFALCLLGGYGWWRLCSRLSGWQPGRLVMLILAAVAATTWLLPSRFAHVDGTLYENLLTLHRLDRSAERYSTRFRLNLPQHNQDAVCTRGRNRRANVVIVLLNSWSTYQSAPLGRPSMTPQLDQLGRQYQRWLTLYANGSGSDDNLYALVFGRNVLGPSDLKQPPAAAGGLHELIPAGYEFAVFGSAPSWLPSEFRSIVTTAGSDTERYGQLLGWMAQQSAETRYVAIVQTVDGQPPFVDPITRAQNQTATLATIDAAAHEFYQTLKRVGFLDNGGLLMFLGGQRAEVPLRGIERQTFGTSAMARLPLLLIGEDFTAAGAQQSAAQIKDLGRSLRYWMTDLVCTERGDGNWLTQPPVAPYCTLYRRHHPADWLDVHCDGESAQVRLAGDDTAIVDGNVKRAEWVLDAINRERVAEQWAQDSADP